MEKIIEEQKLLIESLKKELMKAQSHNTVLLQRNNDLMSQIEASRNSNVVHLSQLDKKYRDCFNEIKASLQKINFLS